MKTKSPKEIGLPAPFATVLMIGLQPRFWQTKKEFDLQCAGFKENRMPFKAYYWDNDTRCYEEVGT
jgi:hypothetical protein